MKRRAAALQSLVDLSRDRVEESEKRLRELAAGKARSEERLRLLADYRAGQAERNGLAEGSRFDLQTLRNAGTFIRKLDAAVEQQQNDVSQWQRGVDRGTAAWQAEQRRLKSFGTLQDRLREKLELAERRTEQKETDEIALRLAARRTE